VQADNTPLSGSLPTRASRGEREGEVMPVLCERPPGTMNELRSVLCVLRGLCVRKSKMPHRKSTTAPMETRALFNRHTWI